jgi:hypothetical protein
MNDPEEERRLESLTLNDIQEIADEGVEPSLTPREKREHYKENFYRFMESSPLYTPHVFSIIGQKLLDEISNSFDYRKRTDPPDSPIHKYVTIDEYIDDEDTMRTDLYVNEPAELLLAGLGDAMIAYGERPREPSIQNQRLVRRIRRMRRCRETDPTRRPQRRTRNTLFRGGSKRKKPRRKTKRRK